jgi:hypothetical protein
VGGSERYTVIAADLCVCSASSLSADSRVLRQHPAAQRLVIDHNPIFISQVLGG